MLTDLIPFKNIGNDTAIIVAIFQGLSPASKADLFTTLSNPTLENLVWALIDDCWTRKPDVRPSMREIEGRIARMQEHSSTLVDHQPLEMPSIPEEEETEQEDETD